MPRLVLIVAYALRIWSWLSVTCTVSFRNLCFIIEHLQQPHSPWSLQYSPFSLLWSPCFLLSSPWSLLWSLQSFFVDPMFYPVVPVFNAIVPMFTEMITSNSFCGCHVLSYGLSVLSSFPHVHRYDHHVHCCGHREIIVWFPCFLSSLLYLSII